MRFCTRCGWPIHEGVLCRYCMAGERLMTVAYYLDGRLHSRSAPLVESIALNTASAWRSEHGNGATYMIEIVA